MAVCSGIKRDGSRCTATVEAPQEYCWWHDPANADKRRRAASKGGRGGGGKEIRDLKKRISEVIDAVLEGSQDRGRAAVAIQGFNALKSVLELERKVKEQEEILERIEALEQSAETAKGGSRWGV
jgi:antitoxin (DNA-binding transcriptional repressor) of toxin-antitoxin stability system